MIDYSSATIAQIAIHHVGNKHREEPNFISENTAKIDDDLETLLIKHFLKPFAPVTEVHRFVHVADVNYNAINGLSSDLFSNSEDFLKISEKVLLHLYEQSSHPHIKSGDVFIVYFKDLFYNEHARDAVGIFKSENKTSFLKLLSSKKNLALQKELGIALNKLDKAALIINDSKEDGYRVYSLDNNSYDAAYWKEQFLGIDYIKDDNYNTAQYVDLCKSFAEEIISEQATRKDEIDFLNHSVNYLEKNENVSFENFKEEVFGDEVQKNAFSEYRRHYESVNETEIAEEFDVMKDVLQKQKRKIRDSIKLDTNISIKLDFNNPESSQHFLEQGYDEERGMKFYKVFYNQEI